MEPENDESNQTFENYSNQDLEPEKDKHPEKDETNQAIKNDGYHDMEP